MMEQILGLNRVSADLTFANMAARAVVVFVIGIIMLRLGARREIGRYAGFDILMMVVLGSVLGRAINGQAAFFPTVGASFLLVMVHRVVSWMAAHAHWFSLWLKGRPVVLIRDGMVDRIALRKCLISHDDLSESLRVNGNVSAPADVREARLERNGEISVVRR